MYIDSAVAPGETAISAGSNDLAEELMLLRASTLKIIRLQLAIERHDRHVALTVLDELIALDRRLQDHLMGVHPTGEQPMFRSELDSERAALSREKLTLAAGIYRRSSNIVAQAGAVEEADLAQADDGWLEPDSLFEPERPRRSRWTLAIVLILFLSALTAGAYFAIAPDAGQMIASAAGALR